LFLFVFTRQTGFGPFVILGPKNEYRLKGVNNQNFDQTVKTDFVAGL
jgi:hypothetical protein